MLQKNYIKVFVTAFELDQTTSTVYCELGCKQHPQPDQSTFKSHHSLLHFLHHLLFDPFRPNSVKGYVQIAKECSGSSLIMVNKRSNFKFLSQFFRVRICDSTGTYRVILGFSVGVSGLGNSVIGNSVTNIGTSVERFVLWFFELCHVVHADLVAIHCSHGTW